MSNEKEMENSLPDLSSMAQNTTEDSMEEDARKLFDSEDVIEPHQMLRVQKWLELSFSLIELQVLKASLEQNAIFEESHNSSSVCSLKYNVKGKRKRNIYIYLKLSL